MAGDLGARAFTVGSDIVIGAGEPGPGTLHGDALLAHELAHAAQQSSGPAPAAKSESGSTDLAEAAADDVAAAAVIGERTGVRGQLAALGTGGGPPDQARPAAAALREARADPTKEDLNKKVLDEDGRGQPRAVAGPGGRTTRSTTSATIRPSGAPRPTGEGPREGDVLGARRIHDLVRKSGVSANAAMDAFFAGRPSPTVPRWPSPRRSPRSATRSGGTKFDRAFGSTEQRSTSPAEPGDRAVDTTPPC